MQKENTTDQKEKDTKAATAAGREAPKAARSKPALNEKQRRELWLYIAVSIVAVELLVTAGAVFYGFMAAGSSEGMAYSFPWLSWGAISVIVPTLILLLVHFADVGLFRAPGGGSLSEAEWQNHLPERMRRIYRIIQGAPVVVVLLGIILLGMVFMTLDGALSTLARLGTVLVPYIPHIVGAVVLLAAIFTGASAWLSYRTRRLMAEYEFRRQVLEQTGVIIVDKDSSALPPGGIGDAPSAITAGEERRAQNPRALPEVRDAVISEERIHTASEPDDDEDIITAEAREVPSDSDNRGD